MLALMPRLASAQAQEVTIGSKADWDAFAARVNAGETSLNASMIANVIEGVTTMVGTENNPYGGTFHGNGFTLTLALSGEGMHCAPFSCVSGATIENLKTTGTVTANDYHASGLVGFNEGGFTARNCWVDANISGSEYFGGLLGHGRSAPFTMENCLFTGRNESSWCAGGLVAWDDDSTPTISNCLNAGTFVYDGFAPIARVAGRGTITNCYYTTATTCSGDLNDDRGTFTDKTGNELAALLGNGWGVIEDEVVPAVFGVNATMKYGDAVPSLENLLSGSLQDVLSISTSATPYSPVGGYPIRITRGSGDNISNYSYGMLQIEKAPLKVTAKSYTIQQGDPLPTFEATYSGFKNKQTVNVLKELPIITCTAVNTAVSGVYDIEVSGGDAENYAFTYVKGKLTIEDGGCEAYAYLSNGELTFCFDGQKGSRTGTTYTLNTGDTAPAWLNDLSGVTKVVFNNSFAQVKPTSTYHWFDGAESLETIEGIGNLNTSEVTNMAGMFQKCRLIESLDVSGWNTSKVKTMSNMFANCSKLGTLDLSGFNTQAVTNMTSMFSGCTALTSLNLSGWNTKNVTRMNGMFASCSALTALDVKHFNTQNVTDMSRMFYNCKALDKVIINQWNTSKVTTTKEMFYGCSTMKSISIRGFDTRKVKNMSYMFANCSGLEALDVQDIETYTATNMSYMFSGCSNIKRIVLNSFDTFNVTDMSYMFANCTNLVTINTGEFWETESASNSAGMFKNCKKLVGEQGTVYNTSHTDKDYARLDGGSTAPGYLSGVAEAYVVKNTERITQSDEWGNSWEEEIGIITFYYDGNKNKRTGTVYEPLDPNKDLSSVTKAIIDPSYRLYRPISTSNMFCEGTQIREIVGLENLITEYVTDMINMFKHCYELSSIDVSGFNTGNVTNMQEMFSNCRSLASIDVSNLDTRNVENMTNMFAWCTSLKSLDVSNFITDKVTELRGFVGGTGLTSIDLSVFGRHHKQYNVIDIFYACDDLEYVDLSNWDLLSTDINSQAFMRWTLPNLRVLKMNNVILPSSMDNLFSGHEHLTTVELNGCEANALTDMSSAFEGCTSLQSVDLSSISANQQISMNSAFKGCTSLESVDFSSSAFGGSTNMDSAFEGCTSLQSVDLSSISANQQISMNSAFKECTSLQSVDFSSSDFSEPTNMESAFEGCTSLQSIDLSSFSANLLTSMSSAFKGCTSLQSVIMPTSSNSLTDLSSVFEGCNRLQTIDLSSFDLSNITNTTNMFSGCRRLQTIYSNQTVAAENSEGMFTDCPRLKGGKGTTFNENNTDASYARVDGGKKTPGYFTAKAVPYVMINDTEMTFYYDTKNFSRQENGCKKYTVLDSPLWGNDANLSFVKNVTFDASFADYQPTTTAGWFAGASTLKTITGLENLQTSSVESMKGMFEDCYSVTSLDLSGFSTDNVTDMTDLFKNCYSMTALDLSDWTLTNVTPMESLRDCFNLKTLTMQNAWMPTIMSGMFKDFTTLTTLDLSGCHTEDVTSMYQLFYGCKGLKTLNLSGWNTSNVKNMNHMFYGCSTIETLNLESFDTQNVTGMISMFYNCSKLTSLDLSGFNTGNVTSMASMFYGCKKLQALTFGENWNTSKVKTMKTMFYNCSALQELDLSGWNLGKVTTTEKMFSGCSSLEKILCDRNWDASSVGTSTSMFAGCTSLVGGNGTIYNASYIDKTYARIDGGKKAPGYLTGISIGIATDMEPISHDTSSEGVYSLDGQKMNNKPAKKGVYIINGRKVVVK